MPLEGVLEAAAHIYNIYVKDTAVSWFWNFSQVTNPILDPPKKKRSAVVRVRGTDGRRTFRGRGTGYRSGN